MKSALNYLFAAALMLFVYGCGAENEGNLVESEATGETSALILEGKAGLWSMGSNVELKFADDSNPGYVFASGKIKSDGTFKISVPAPDKSELRPIAELSKTELSISDLSAKFLTASAGLYAGGESFGRLEWSSEFNGEALKAKYCRAVYFYCDKDVTVSGASYGFKAQAGWNTLYVYTDGSSNFYYSDEADAEGGYAAYGEVRG